MDTYVTQILEETLRLWPTAPAFTRRPYENTVIGGKYQLGKDDGAVILVSMLHRDKHIWGENPEQFDPDRFSPENRTRIPPNAYKPLAVVSAPALAASSPCRKPPSCCP
jgi:cytochrome P450 / NADPH-cytochrome P450 reductase